MSVAPMVSTSLHQAVKLVSIGAHYAIWVGLLVVGTPTNILVDPLQLLVTVMALS